MTDTHNDTLGWIGTGRMGYALCERLLERGADLWVYNRTRAKAEPLADLGATVVDHPSELAGRDIVFTMVSGSADALEVTLGPNGVLSRPGGAPRILVDSSTISPGASEELRAGAAAVGTELVVAPVSGNPKVVSSGKLTSVVSGPEGAYETVKPYLEMYGSRVTYVGAGDEARLVKICHNLMLGVVAQNLAEITLLANAAGVPRAAFLEFLNNSVMGSIFTRYKSPMYVSLDWLPPTFTWDLLKKDFDLGLEQAEILGVELPTATLVRSIVESGIEKGLGDNDFAALLELAALESNIDLVSEAVAVDDGLS